MNGGGFFPRFDVYLDKCYYSFMMFFSAVKSFLTFSISVSFSFSKMVSISDNCVVGL